MGIPTSQTPPLFLWLSALAHYSLLSDDPYPTFALSKESVALFLKKEPRFCHPGEEPHSVFQELGYVISSFSKDAIDPLSVALILEEEGNKDPRVAQAIDVMLNEQIWSKV